MEAAGTSETLVCFCHTTLLYTHKTAIFVLVPLRTSNPANWNTPTILNIGQCLGKFCFYELDVSDVGSTLTFRWFGCLSTYWHIIITSCLVLSTASCGKKCTKGSEFSVNVSSRSPAVVFYFSHFKALHSKNSLSWLLRFTSMMYEKSYKFIVCDGVIRLF
jgi:hypothetical protein